MTVGAGKSEFLSGDPERLEILDAQMSRLPSESGLEKEPPLPWEASVFFSEGLQLIG